MLNAVVQEQGLQKSLLEVAREGCYRADSQDLPGGASAWQRGCQQLVPARKDLLGVIQGNSACPGEL